MKQALRGQGTGKRAKLQPELVDLCRELLAAVNELHWLEPAIAYEFYPISAVYPDRLLLEGDTVFSGRLLPSLVAEARELGVVVSTIGPRLEEEVAGYFRRNEPLRGLLLDGIGNAAMDSLSHQVCQFMSREASSRGYKASSPLSPGMPGWSITEQRRLFRLVPAEQIGVRLTSAAMMGPRKSTSMVVGIGPDMPAWTEAEGCNRCGLKRTCPYKVYA